MVEGGHVIMSTTRFGQVQLNEEDVIMFPEGLLGFADHHRFLLVDDPTDDIFAWLQSCDDPAVAFPVLEPELFMDSYKVSLARTDFEALQISKIESARLYCIVTIPDDPTLMTANLKAPVVLNVAARIARQCVLQDNSLAIREPIFVKLQKRAIANPGRPMKNQISLEKSAGEKAAPKSEKTSEEMSQDNSKASVRVTGPTNAPENSSEL